MPECTSSGVNGGNMVDTISEHTRSEHTTKAFDADLHDLIRMVAEMGGLAESLIRDAVDALTERNVELARRTVAADDAADQLQREIEGKAVITIARRQPMAVDLREVVGILRIANDLERIGDLAKNIARRVIALDGEPTPHRPIRGFKNMAALVLGQLRDVLDSFVERDLPKATSVWTRDEKIDAMYTSLFRELLTYMMEDPGTITFGIHLLFCAKNIERIGDHTTNIAEAVHYIIDGQSFATERPKADATSLMPVAFGGT
jgi:phosphate transport system protein